MTWMIIFLIYTLGVYALHCMSLDFSTAPRTAKTVVSLAFWPLTTAFAAVADAWDFLERKFL